MTMVAPPAYQETRQSSDVPAYTAGDYKKLHVDVVAPNTDSAESSPSSSSPEKNEGRDGWTIWTANLKSAASKAKSVWGNASSANAETNVWGRATSNDREDTNVWGPAIAAKSNYEHKKSYADIWQNGQGIHGRDAATRKV